MANVCRHHQQIGCINTALKLNKKHYQLSDKSLQEILTVASSFYTHLVNEDTLKSNPVLLIRQKSKFFKKQHVPTKQVMKLSEKQWQYVLICG